MIKQPSIIGITSYGRNNKQDYTVPAHYVDSVRRAGGIPLLIPPGEQNIEYIINKVDGFVLTGGGDIDPKWYHGKNHKAIYNVDQERDSTELSLAKFILKEKAPTLAICRGLQIINTALGGTLHEHLPDVYGNQILHRKPPRETTNHDVAIEEDTILYRILKKDRIATISWHHQAIDRLGEGLSVSARSEDGVIEAVELKNEPWLISVQWHPELSSATNQDHQMLFDALLESTAAKA